ncbi:WD40 repeat domain-containing protein [Nonomuraea sp. NPDC046570]|uniref:WD40 repeat domain-containing protein n=1 Tax=Nonomuraea sp. NPDC046570 TaxID=3155255 RepID=UPI0033F18781
MSDILLSARKQELAGTSNVGAIAMSGDGRTAISGDLEQGTTVWRLLSSGSGQQWSPRARLEGHKEYVTAAVLTPDGSTAITGDHSGAVIVWDLDDQSTPSKEWEFDSPERSAVQHMAITPDGALVLAGFDSGAVEMWTVRDQSRPTRRGVLRDGNVWIQGLALSADGRIAIIASGGKGHVWNLADYSSPRRVAVLENVHSAAIGADGLVAVTGGDPPAAVRLWDFRDPSKPDVVGSFPDDGREVNSVALTPDARLALTSTLKGLTTLWTLGDPAHPKALASLKESSRVVNEVAISHGGDVAMIGTSGQGAISWDIAGISGSPLLDACSDAGKDSGLMLTPERWENLLGNREWSEYFGGREKFDPCE